MGKLECDKEKLDFGLVTASQDGRLVTPDHGASQTIEISSSVGAEDTMLNIACFPSWLDCRFSDGRTESRLPRGKAVRVLATLRKDPRAFRRTKPDDAIIVTTTLEDMPYIAVPTTVTAGEEVWRAASVLDAEDQKHGREPSRSQDLFARPVRPMDDIRGSQVRRDKPPVDMNEPPPRRNWMYDVFIYLLLALVALLIWATTSAQAKRIAGAPGLEAWRYPDLEAAGVSALDESQMLTLIEQRTSTGLHRGDYIFDNGRFVGRIGTVDCRVSRDKAARTEIIVCRRVTQLGGWAGPLVAAKVLVDSGTGTPVTWLPIAVPDYALDAPLPSETEKRSSLRNDMLLIHSFVLGLALVAGVLFYGSLGGARVSAKTMLVLSFLAAMLGLALLPEVSPEAFVYRIFVNTALVWISTRGFACLLREYGRRNNSVLELADRVLPANWA